MNLFLINEELLLIFERSCNILLAMMYKKKNDLCFNLPATGDNFRITHHLDFHCKINYNLFKRILRKDSI